MQHEDADWWAKVEWTEIRSDGSLGVYSTPFSLADLMEEYGEEEFGDYWPDIVKVRIQHGYK